MAERHEPVWSGTPELGKITYLRVCHGNVVGYGVAPDRLDTEVIVKHSAEPNRAFGFYLRPSTAGENLSANLAMLSAIRDSMVNNIPVGIGYWVRSILIRQHPEIWEDSNCCIMEALDLEPNP